MSDLRINECTSRKNNTCYYHFCFLFIRVATVKGKNLLLNSKPLPGRALLSPQEVTKFVFPCENGRNIITYRILIDLQLRSFLAQKKNLIESLSNPGMFVNSLTTRDKNS